MPDVDLFAGADGWGLGASALGLRLLGIELEPIVCATREAAGAETICADVAELDPLGFAPCRVLVGSPPCPPWSQAGKREGAEDWPVVRLCTEALRDGHDLRSEFRPTLRDARSLLVVEPLRWALALRPEVVALEQVPPVLPYWRDVAAILGEVGYATWAGVLEAERYGVPQTRERAILMASRTGAVHPPPPTHQRYVPGEPARAELTLDGELLPWVSMAEALGWNADGRVGFGRRADEGEATEDGYRARDFRDAVEPALALTEKSRSWTREPAASAKEVKWINGTHEHRAERRGDEPAPTLHFGARLNKVEWTRERPAPTIVGGRRSKDGGIVGRQLAEGEGENVGGWGWGRPSTTVQGDPRVHPPGHKENSDDPPDTYEQRRGANAVRVTVEEAAILQGFPPGYPWQGNRTQQFMQVGNAFPPPVARAVLEALGA